MKTTVAHPERRLAVGFVAIAAHLVAFVAYVVLPGLEVPYPALYAFQLAWIAVMLVAIAWTRRHPRRSMSVVLAGLVLVTVVRILGEQHFGWRG